MDLLQTYLIPSLVLGFIAWRYIQSRRVRAQLPALLQAGAVVVDVRSREEFASGAREGSLNIPLGELESGILRLDRNKPVIVCCASGTRSAIAGARLKASGFKTVVNAGSWHNTLV